MSAKKKIASPLRIGNPVFIRTVTHYYTGRVVGLSETEILLDEAAWIADTGRFSEALKSGSLNEVEPFAGVVSIGRGSLIDATDWVHQLPLAVR